MSHKIENLCPVVQGMCKTFIGACKERGIAIIITSTLRTAAEQLAYFAQGRKSLKAVNEFRRQAGLSPITMQENKRTITNTLDSFHLFACALDFAIEKEGLAIWDIKADVNQNDIPDYEECGKIAEAIGFAWGGRFPKKDYVHLQYTGGLTIADLQAGKRPHDPSTPRQARCSGGQDGKLAARCHGEPVEPRQAHGSGQIARN
jgi:peptidoglycan L-alanyl-D-glutamate endopeptidase CwlK